MGAMTSHPGLACEPRLRMERDELVTGLAAGRGSQLALALYAFHNHTHNGKSCVKRNTAPGWHPLQQAVGSLPGPQGQRPTPSHKSVCARVPTAAGNMC